MDNKIVLAECGRRKNYLSNMIITIINNYKSLRDISKRTKPFKIIEIAHLSRLPEKTKFVIQVANKNCALTLSALDIYNNYCPKDNFSNLDAEIINRAIKGTLIEFIDAANDNKPLYRISSKKFDRTLEQYVFTIHSTNELRIIFTAEELSKNKHFLENMNIQDIFDIAYTQGAESILKEKLEIQLAKNLAIN